MKARGKGSIPTASEVSRAVSDSQSIILNFLAFAQLIEAKLKDPNYDFSALRDFNENVLNTTIVLDLQAKLGAIQAVK